MQVRLEGEPATLRLFIDRLPAKLPREARLDELCVVEIDPILSEDFRIRPTTVGGLLSVSIPPDRATCVDCFAEVAEMSNRRSEFLFTTCTHCGPRYSLIRAMPYDRGSTGMALFDQCPKCHSEYVQPIDRRFHSQTNSCRACGPRLWLTDAGGEPIHDEELALPRAASALLQGTILAVKGIGGYQLMVDATCSASVNELRRRKQRWGKPLAVMVADIAGAESLATLSAADRESLACPANPIVVAAVRTTSPLSCQVAEGLATVGLMLPTSPLHEFLVRRAGRPLVVTSGNLEGDPLVFDETTAESELRHVPELFLHHNRPIVRPIDDSVIQCSSGRTATIRLARGLAPLPLELKSDRAILALGGHQKVAIALTNGAQAVLGPHVGDLENELVRTRYLSHIDAMCRLYGAQPSVLAHDLHTDYFTTRWAAEQSIATLAVQHHHAHIAAGLLEHHWLDREVLGVAWDGTGYGPDGTIWGGEFLIATATDFRRVAHLRPLALPGGEAAVNAPWRVAVTLVWDSLGPDAALHLRFPNVPVATIEDIVRVVKSTKLCPITTSAGRLFDGVAALALGIAQSQFEGQPAMLLEAACDLSASGEYELPMIEGEPSILDWQPLICGVISDLRSQIPAGTIAMKFHRALASAIVTVASRYNHLPVVLAGGCFHNCVLTELVSQQFSLRRQPLGLPGVIPTNDGGLAAGQLAVAIARLRQKGFLCA